MINQYRQVEPPFAFDNYSSMTAQQAKEHFEWFVAQQDKRITELLNWLESHDGQPLRMDYSLESLEYLWKKIGPGLNAEVLSGEKETAARQQYDDWFNALDIKLKTLYPETISLALDMGFYLAAVLQKRHSHVEWNCWNGNDAAKNKPYLTGFELPLIPVDLVISCVWAYLDGNHTQSLLLDKCKVWLEDLE